MITSQASIDQAQRARDNQLIAQYMTGELTLLGIANMNSMTLNELIEWSEQPHIEKLLTAIAEASALRAQRLAADATPHAIAKLTQLLSAKNEETARRAASAILHASKTVQHGQSAARVRPRSQREGLGVGSISKPLPEGGVGVDSSSKPSQRKGLGVGAISLSSPPKASITGTPSPERRHTQHQRPSNVDSTPKSIQPHLTTEIATIYPSRVIRTPRPVEDNFRPTLESDHNPYRAVLNNQRRPGCTGDPWPPGPPRLASGSDPADKPHVPST